MLDQDLRILLIRGLAASGSSAITKYAVAKSGAAFINEYCIDTPHLDPHAFCPTIALEQVLVRSGREVGAETANRLEKKAKLELLLVAEELQETKKPLIIREWHHHYFTYDARENYLKVERVLRDVLPNATINSVAIIRDPLENFLSAVRSKFWDVHNRNFHIWINHFGHWIDKLEPSTTFLGYEKVCDDQSEIDSFLASALASEAPPEITNADIYCSGNSGRSDPAERGLNKRPKREEDASYIKQMMRFDSVARIYEKLRSIHDSLGLLH